MPASLTRRAMLGALGAAAGSTLLPRAASAAAAVDDAARDGPLRRSDVVFMYEADAATYRDYGATVLAWGGTPNAKSLAEARGVTFYGSVGMVTEFADYHDRFPDTWHEGVCLDIDGSRIKVPWLVDHSHAGEPFWWCCTRQPVFRAFLEARVTETLERGAHGLHVDDHLGTAGALFLAACFCARCVDGFRGHLAALDASARARLAVGDPAAFDYGAVLRRWRADRPAGTARAASDHPLWPEWRVYQLRSAAAYMARLRSVAERAAGRRVPVSANAGVLWPNHLADYEAVDFFSAEIDHDAGSRRVSDRPLFAYRLADGMDRMLAATARGEDWAQVLAERRHGLALSWAALGYASGHMLMAPHRQWCHTAEKGTHWYEGPREVFAPFFRFVREQAAPLLDTLEAFADVALVVPHRAFASQPSRWIAMGERLSASNVSYRLVVGGDAVVPRAIGPRRLHGRPVVVNPAPEELQPQDRAALSAGTHALTVVGTVDEAIRVVRPAVSAAARDVLVLPRVAPGRAVVHVLNRAYDPGRDAVRPVREVELTCDLERLGVPRARRARIVPYGAAPRDIPLDDGRMVVDVPGVWTLVEVTG
jgi:hypothetical protein